MLKNKRSHTNIVSISKMINRKVTKENIISYIYPIFAKCVKKVGQEKSMSIMLNFYHKLTKFSNNKTKITLRI